MSKVVGNWKIICRGYFVSSLCRGPQNRKLCDEKSKNKVNCNKFRAFLLDFLVRFFKLYLLVFFQILQLF